MYEIVGNQQKYYVEDSKHGIAAQWNTGDYQKPSNSSQINEYQLPSSSRDNTLKTSDKKRNKKTWFVTIGMLITVLIILTVIAIALAALGYQKVEGTQTSAQQAASGNNTEIQREINELRTQLQQLRSYVMENITLYSNTTLISDKLLSLQGDFASVNETLYAVNSDIRSLDSHLQSDSTENSIVSSRVNHLSLSINSVGATQSSQISALQTVSSSLYRSISSVSSRFSSSLSRSISSVSRFSSSLSGSISLASSSLSRSISSVSRRFSSVSRTQSSEIRVLQTSNPYQNCIQETRNCTINVLTSSNKRLYCNTGSLSVNRTVSIRT